MKWRDIDDGGWEGLAVELTTGDVPRRPDWNVDVARPGCVRVTAGGVARWWGRVDPRWAGVDLLRGEPMTADDAVVRPITAAEVRAVADAPGSVAWWRVWSRWFAEAMVASGRSPLRPGTWWFAPATCKDLPGLAVAGRGRRRSTLSSRWEPGRPHILRALGPQWTEDAFGEDWFISSGSHALLPLRRASSPDAGRVKSWRKHARGGVLPPVLVYFVAALDVFVLLDGHDRLAAAQAEGVPVPWLLASALLMATYPHDEARRAGLVREAERMMARDPAAPADAINRLYLLGYDERPWPLRVCYGRALAGGAASFEREVRRRLAVLGLEKEGRGLLTGG